MGVGLRIVEGIEHGAWGIGNRREGEKGGKGEKSEKGSFVRCQTSARPVDELRSSRSVEPWSVVRCKKSKERRA